MPSIQHTPLSTSRIMYFTPHNILVGYTQKINVDNENIDEYDVMNINRKLQDRFERIKY